jgi:hypothetical protein
MIPQWAELTPSNFLLVLLSMMSALEWDYSFCASPREGSWAISLLQVSHPADSGPGRQLS